MFMSQYRGYSQDIDDLYARFVDYYSDPIATKIEERGQHSVYYVKIMSHLGYTSRYLVIIIPRNMDQMHQQRYLSELRWVSFQTRTLPADHPLRPQEQRRLEKDPLKYKLQAHSRDEQKTDYYCQGPPVRVALLHDLKQKNTYQYPDNLLLSQALNSYECVVALL